MIDDFFANPGALREVALDPNRSWFSPESGYPGVFSWPDPDHMPLLGELASFLSSLTNRQLGQSDQIQFSMVTKTAEELTATQRRPHFDGFNFGGLVYLNSPEQCKGGNGVLSPQGYGTGSVSRQDD